MQLLAEEDVWLREQSKDIELGDNEEEAKLQLDIFNRQYNTLTGSRERLISNGRILNQKIADLDQELFGSRDIGIAMHERVEKLVVKVEKRKDKMEEKAQTRLKLLQNCENYFTYKLMSEEVDTLDCPHSSAMVSSFSSSSWLAYTVLA